MRPWLHLTAVFTGFVVAAIIVVVVFSRADEEAARQTGGAVGSAATATPDRAGVAGAGGSCARVRAGSTASAAALRTAAAHPPTLFNEAGQEVSQPRSAAQRSWITRVNAALGSCTEELAITRTTVRASATFPADLASSELDGYAYAMLVQAFRPPLVRNVVQLEAARGPRSQRLVIRATAWNAFEHGRAAYRLPASIAGLRAFRQRTGLTQGELAFVNWR